MNDYENYSTIRQIITANSSVPIISGNANAICTIAN
jgi:hypothetical protein